MIVDTHDEHPLIQKAELFDERALSEIYDLYSPGLYRYAMRLLGDQQLSEDCLSDTFLRLLKVLRGGQGTIDHLQPYLYRIAHNWITDFYRRNRNDMDELSEEVAASTTSTIEQVETNLRADHVRRAVLLLPAEQQQVILLKYLEGWDTEEISRVLKKNKGAIRALVFRALKTLRRKLTLLEK